MSRKKRKTYSVLPMPKLGWKDRLLYTAIIVLLIALGISGMFIVDEISQRIAFMDESVVASAGGPGSLNCIWLSLWYCFAAIIVFIVPCCFYRYPIFGRKDTEYGPPKHPFVYPLLMKNRPVKKYSRKEAERRKKQKRIIAAVIVGSFLICVLLVPLSVCGRTVMCGDGSMEVYNMFNQFSRRYAADEIETVSIGVYWSTRHSDAHVKMDLETADGKQFNFAASSFRGDEYTQLCKMIEMKEKYGNICVIEDADHLEEVVWRQHLTEPEIEKLYELFGMPVP